MARSTLTALALCSVLALLGASELVLNPGSNLAGDWRHPDCLGNHWLLVWVADQLLSLQGILHNPLYYWPHGDAPWLAGNGSEGFLYLPFHALLEWPVSVNLYATCLLLGNGLAGCYLGRSAGAGPWASLLVGSATGCSVYANLEMGAGRFSQADLIWLLTALGSFLRLLKEPGTRLALMTGTLSALCAFFYFYYAFFLVLAVAVICASYMISRRELPWKHLAVTATTAGLLILPVLALFLTHWSSIPGTSEAFPHPMVAIDSIRPANLLAPGGTPQQSSQGVAAPILILSLIGIYRLFRSHSEDPVLEGGLLGVVFLSWWLALGPAGGLWTWLYGASEPLQRFWWPYRHVVLIGPLLGVLAARALVATGRDRPIHSILIALSVPFCLSLQPLPLSVARTSIATPPPIYPALTQRPEEVLLSVPFTGGATGSQAPLIYQIYHRKKMLNGHAPWVDRVRPPAWDDMVETNSFLAALAALEHGESGNDLAFSAQDLTDLIDQGLGLFVVDRELVPVDLWAMVRGYNQVFQGLFGDPVLATNGIQVYTASSWNGQDRVRLDAFKWPDGVPLPEPNRLLNGRRPRSPMFDPR